MPLRARWPSAGVGRVFTVVIGSVALSACSSGPETPGNAVLDFGNDIALEDYQGVWDRLCSRLREDALGGPGDEFAEIQEFVRHEGSFSTNYETEVDGDTAREPITVRPRGVPDEGSNEQWVAHLVKEDGRWRVCGFERVS